MCGIFGGYNVSNEEVIKGVELIKRGNDGVSIDAVDENIIFGARRHAIKFCGNEKNLLNRSDQPYYSDDKDVALIFNGEFYNFEEYKLKLKKDKILFKSEGDTEVLLKLYEKYGISFLRDKKIDSLYSIAIYDKKLKKIFIARDWPGRIPLYYYYDEQKFIFSSELKAFRAIKNLSLQKPIELVPGQIIEYDIKNRKLKLISNYSLDPYISKNSNNILKLGEEMHKILDSSSKNRTMGDVPICTMLSGGIDSVLTTYYVLKNINFKAVNYEPTSYVFKVKLYDKNAHTEIRTQDMGFKVPGANHYTI